MGQAGGNWPSSLPVNEVTRGGFSPALADLGSPFKRLLLGRFGFAAQAKHMWGLALVTGDARSIFCTIGATFVSDNYSGL